MSFQQRLSQFFQDTTEATDNAALWGIMRRFCENYGLLHARISVYDLQSQIDKIHFKHVITYPEGPDSWGEYYIEKRMFDHDRSFHLIFERQTEALYWSKMEELTRTGTQANNVFVEMRNFGIGEGILIAKSSQILKHTILLGLAGPGKAFKTFKAEGEAMFIKCFQVFIARYLELALRDDLLDVAEGLQRIELSARSKEVLRALSLGKTSNDVSDMLGVTPDAINKIISRLKSQTGVATREGLVAYALRTGQIH
jgi:DNA-binding CsgD family transcriptional regulator